MKHFILVLVMLVFASMQWGCASMSSMQTAEALKVGDQQFTVGGGTYNSKSFNVAMSGTSTDPDLTASVLEISYRRGMAEKIDVGIKYTLPGTLTADGKYQFLDGETFDAAAGLGLDYFSMETGPDNARTKTTIIDLIVPLYLSAKLSDSFTPYLSPRYLLRNISGVSSGTTSVIGATGGVKIGKTWGLYVEYGIQKGVGNDFTANQANVAFFWD
jgi:hypothetical protein